MRKPESDAGDGRRCISADAGEFEDRGIVAGERAMLRDQARSLEQIACARIIAQTAPVGEDFVFRRVGQRLRIRKTRQESLIIRNRGSDACLLQHDLGDPDRVGIARAPPGQIAAMLHIPLSKLLSEGG